MGVKKHKRGPDNRAETLDLKTWISLLGFAATIGTILYSKGSLQGEMQQQLTFIQTNLTELKTDNKELRKELKEDISALKGGMKEEFTALKGEITVLSKDLNGLALKFTDDLSLLKGQESRRNDNK